MTHRELCIIGAKWLRQTSIDFAKSQYVSCELERVGECPDIFGFGGWGATRMIEVKVSRADFLSDKKKYWRKIPSYGLGDMRYYLCPTGLIEPKDLPKRWGLLYCDEKGKITIAVKAERQEANKKEEIHLICGIMRRENITPRVFSYKQYNSENNL